MVCITGRAISRAISFVKYALGYWAKLFINFMLFFWSGSPPGSPPEGAAAGINPLEMSRLTLWNLYHTPEPQKEALDLGKRDDPIPPPPPKRHYPDNSQDEVPNSAISGAHIKISSRGNK